MSVLVILPGLDGSPHLQGALPQALQKLPGMAGLQQQTILYPPQQKLDYLALARWVQPQLPQEQPFFLLGESFGGPLALLLAGCGQGDAQLPAPKHLRGVVLAASFATCAVPWAAPFLPAIAASPAQAVVAGALGHAGFAGRLAASAATLRCCRSTEPRRTSAAATSAGFGRFIRAFAGPARCARPTHPRALRASLVASTAARAAHRQRPAHVAANPGRCLRALGG